MICEFCGYEFPDELGRYGCPNCLGEPLEVKTMILDIVIGVVIAAIVIRILLG